MEEPSLVEIDADRAMHWLSVGAQPTDQVQQLLRVAGVWERFESERPATAAKVARVDAGKAGARTNAKRAAAQESARAEKAAQAAAAQHDFETVAASLVSATTDIGSLQTRLDALDAHKILLVQRA